MLTLGELLARKLLMVSGKGGTGKTVVAAALAMKAAALGKKVLVVESAVTEQLTPLFGHRSVGHRETPVAENIAAINLNPRLCFKEYVVDHLGMVQLYKRVFDHRVVKSFLDAIPGLAETMLLGRLFHSCELQAPPRYDLVIFDAPAMGHFYTLLTTSDAIIGSGLMGPLVKEVQRVRDFIANPQKCGALLVTLPEELVTSETLEFIPRLHATTPVPLLGVVLNRAITPGPFPGAMAATSPAWDYLRTQHELRQRAQQALVEGLQALRTMLTHPAFGLPGVLFDQGPLPEPLSPGLVDRLLAGWHSMTEDKRWQTLPG